MMSAPLVWSRTLPTEHGWYWLRSKGEEPRVTEVYSACTILWCTAFDGDRSVAHLFGSEWAGPLVPPEGEAP